MNDHTKGKWVYDEKRPFYIYSDDATGSIIASCDSFQYAQRPDKEKAANAKIMTAAPEMLEALKNLENDDGKAMPPSAWRLVKDAIKKAEGVL
jgi:hypothetical protein